MEQYKIDFINFMIDSNVLTFGDFTTKSGRKTPFFINAGKEMMAQDPDFVMTFSVCQESEPAKPAA